MFSDFWSVLEIRDCESFSFICLENKSLCFAKIIFPVFIRFWLLKKIESFLLKKVSFCFGIFFFFWQLFNFLYLPAKFLSLWTTRYCFTVTYNSISPGVPKTFLYFWQTFPNQILNKVFGRRTNLGFFSEDPWNIQKIYYLLTQRKMLKLIYVT